MNTNPLWAKDNKDNQFIKKKKKEKKGWNHYSRFKKHSSGETLFSCEAAVSELNLLCRPVISAAALRRISSIEILEE